MFDWILFLQYAAVLFSGSLIQGAAGFAFGIFSTPVLVWLGCSLPEAVGIVIGGVLIQLSVSSWKMRSHIPWKITAASGITRMLFTPIGLLLLYNLSQQNAGTVKQILGGIILVTVLLQFLKAPKGQDVPASLPGMALAFSASGIMAGAFGMGGPPLVLWTLRRNWENNKLRAFMFTSFLISTPFQLAFMAIWFEPEVRQSIVYGLACAPFLITGTLLGLAIGERFSKKIMRTIAVVLLVIIAIQCMHGQ